MKLQFKKQDLLMKDLFFFSKKCNGFTLLELMIVSGFLVITLAGLLATYIACLELTETTKNTNLALNTAQKILEEVRSTAFTSIYSAYNGYGFEISGMLANSSLERVTVDNTDPNLLNVTIGACWRQKSGRILGECQDMGGVVTFSDVDGDGILDSPAQLTTLMTQR